MSEVVEREVWEIVRDRGCEKGGCEEEGWLKEVIANTRPVLADPFHTLPSTTYTNTHIHVRTVTERRYS